MLFCAYPVMTVRIMGAFKTHLRQYCGPGRRPPGCPGLGHFGNGFMAQDIRKDLTSLLLPRYPFSMSMIYMIRHGQASFGKEDYDQLSPLGKRQARILAQHFLDTGFHPDAVYSGNMSRHTATAQEMLSAYRVARRNVPQLEMLSGFNEYDITAIVKALFPDMVKNDPSLKDDLPRMSVSKDSFKRVFEGALLRWVTGEFDTPDIESWEALKDRVAESLHLIMERHGKGKTIAVFTSGGAIAASLAHVLAISGERAMRLNWQILNASVSRFMYNKERVTLAGFNSIAHLELAGDPTLITYR
jgi:broad specificity phosphatase PhoE